MSKTKILELYKNILKQIFTKTSLSILSVSLVSVLLSGVAAFQLSGVLPQLLPNKVAEAYIPIDDSCNFNVTVNQSASQIDPVAFGEAKFTVVFSQPIDITSFGVNDISFEINYLRSINSITQIAPFDGTTFEVSISAASSVPIDPIIKKAEYSYLSTVLGTTGTNPFGITIDSVGNIYTANNSTNNISKITPAGVSTILAGTGTGPFGIVIDTAGNLYTTNQSSNSVTKTTPAGVTTIFGSTGTNPKGIAIDAAGNIYTANNGSNNVSKITPAGSSFILGSTASFPEGITIDAAGNIYTANAGGNNISKITPIGGSSILGSTGAGTSPRGIVIDTVGNLYTANNGTANVSKVTPAGVSTTFGTAGSNPEGITIDTVGNIYVTNNIGNTVTKISATGVSSTLPASGTRPFGIVLDADGNLYTANNNSANVTKYTKTLSTGVKTNLGCGNSASTSTDNLVTVDNSNKTGSYIKYYNASTGKETDTITTAPGSTVQQRIYYDNTTTREITGASIQASIPAGFTYVPNSFRNCKSPTYSQAYCDSNGATVDNAMFAKLTSTGLSPAAAFYDSADTGANGTSPTSTTGILDAGKRPKLSLKSCSFGDGGGGDFNINALINATPTDSYYSFFPQIDFGCNSSYFGKNNIAGFSNAPNTEYNLTNNRYFNLGQCFYDFQFKGVSGWTNQSSLGNARTTATGTSNSLINGDGCVGGDSFGRGWKNYTILGNRYLNIDQCVYLYNSTFQTKFTSIVQTPSKNTSTNTSNTPIISNGCTGTDFLPAFSSVKAIDMLDTREARGYFTFQMTVPTTNVQASYITTPIFTGTSPLTGVITPIILSGTILTGVNTCPAGQFFNSTTVTCNPCPAGSFCTGGVGAVASQCPINTYCPVATAVAIPCPVNSTSPAGSVDVSACTTPSTPTAPTLNINVNLAGNFNSTTDAMSNLLRSPTLLIPNTQPFTAAPYSYTGTETLPTTNLSANICDWVLIEIRDANDVVVMKKAALLKTNGEVIDATNAITGNTTTGISLPGVTTTGSYKIIVRHRNHIPIATNTPITLTLGAVSNIDFTTNANVKGNNQIQVSTIGTGNTGSPIYGLRSADSNKDGATDALDRSNLDSSSEASNVYDTRDLNLDGAIDAIDRGIVQNVPEANQFL